MKEIISNTTFIEMVGKILPAMMAGVFTFLITKYTYNRNVPLDKLEVAYNRVYYPIYCLIESDKEISQVIEECDFYIMKYRKFVDRSTICRIHYY